MVNSIFRYYIIYQQMILPHAGDELVHHHDKPGEDSPAGEPVSGSIPKGNEFRRVVMASPLVNVRALTAHDELQQFAGMR
jgi:hypothetical protein